MDKLKVCNIVLTGHFPFKRKLTSKEIDKLINKSNTIYIMNSEDDAFIRAFFEKDTLNKHKKKRNAVVSLSLNGGININGVESIKEAQELYNKVLEDIMKAAKDILEAQESQIPGQKA